MPGADRGPFESASVPEGYQRHLAPVIFEPWAERLLELAALRPGETVLDVASGTGVVARAAARAVGADGQVLASDISGAMLAHVADGLDARHATVRTLECPADALLVDDAAVDAVCCQQGFPFIPDRAAAAREMRRVLRPGGRAVVAVWLADRWLDPFDAYGEVLREAGVEDPFPDAYDTTRFKMSRGEVEGALAAGGLAEVEVGTQELELRWADAQAAALGIVGTPYGPALAALPAGRQQEVMDRLRDRFVDADGGLRRQVNTAVLGRGTAR